MKMDLWFLQKHIIKNVVIAVGISVSTVHGITVRSSPINRKTIRIRINDECTSTGNWKVIFNV
jgi:hypothetical protein